MLPIIWWLGIIVCSLLRIQLTDTAKLIPHMGYYIEMKQMDCVGNPNYFADMYCRIIPPKNRTMEASLNVMQPMSAFSGSLRVSIPNAKKVMTQIFDITFDGCKVLRERKRKIIIDLLVNTLAKNGSGKLWRCPISKGKFESRNISVTDLPPMLTESEFLVNLDFFIPKVATVMNVTLHGHLYEVAKERHRRKKYL
ncbi:uncharacterized protein LOC6546810 [Drosophila erecta]|uniref:MD-2-related lipid-recognition domain-containing protein n=1 Tax=Drosophila erecta TaxID=7220 RepID=B3NS18_DROER|nr:uncharacterized protein LOC6546810 [Drosophila erecta]EDV56320.2 uncharacterized protein Dere_GG20296 [Drosophila erecta]